MKLLCSAQGEPPITFSWEKDQKPLESFTETKKPHRSSLLVVTVKDQNKFWKIYLSYPRSILSTAHTISIQNDTGNTAFDLFNLHKFDKPKPNQNTIISVLNQLS